MYEILFKYIIASRSKIVQQNRENKALEPVIKERVGTLVQQRINKTTQTKIEKELAEYKKKFIKLSQKFTEKETETTSQKTIIKDLKDKFDGMISERYKYEEKIEELKQQNSKLQIKLDKTSNRKTKYMNKYRTTQTVLDEEIKEKELLQEKYNKYIKKSNDKPNVQKYIDKCKMYSNKIKESDILVTKYKTEHDNINLKYNTLIKKYNKLVQKLKEYKETPIITIVKKPEEKKTEKVEVIEQYTVKKLNGNNVNELKVICRHKGISGYSKFCKSDLITYMMQSEKIIRKYYNNKYE
jgi:chromosome segregation ATPase